MMSPSLANWPRNLDVLVHAEDVGELQAQKANVVPTRDLEFPPARAGGISRGGPFWWHLASQRLGGGMEAAKLSAHRRSVNEILHILHVFWPHRLDMVEGGFVI